MNAHHIASALLALVVLTGTAAALPAAAQGNDHASDADAYAEDATEPRDANESDARDDAGAPDDVGPNGDGPAASAGERGPPASLPGQVPDFVSGIHEAIGNHLAGTLDGNLGDVISGLTPGDEGDDASDDVPDDGNATDAADGTATPVPA